MSPAMKVALMFIFFCLGMTLLITLRGDRESAGEKNKNGDQAARVALLKQKGEAAHKEATRIQELLRRPWMQNLKGVHRSRLYARAQSLVTFHDNVIKNDITQLDALLERGKTLIDQRSSDITRTVDALTAVEDFANQAELLRRNLNELVSNARVPLNSPFPLRNRVRQAFLPQQNALLGQLETAIDAFVQNGDAVRVNMIQRNLGQIISEGNKLYQDLNLMIREVDNTERQLNQIETRTPFVRTVIEAAESALASGQAPASVKQEQVAESKAALDDATKAAVELKAEWPALRLLVFEEKDRAAFDAFRKRVSDALAGLNTTPRLLAAALKIADPDEPKRR